MIRKVLLVVLLVPLIMTTALWVVSFFTGAVLIWRIGNSTFVAHSQRNIVGLRLSLDYRDGDHTSRFITYPNPDTSNIRSAGLWEELHATDRWVLPRIGLGYRQGRTPLKGSRAGNYHFGDRPIHMIYFPPPQQNLWASTGSGSWPSA